MIVLGLGQMLLHDPSATLLVDGQVAAAIEEERLCRVKHAPGHSALGAARRCLEIAGIGMDQVDAIAVPYSYENIRRLRYACFRRSLGRRGKKAWRILRKGGGKERRVIEDAREVARALGATRDIPVFCIEHHVAHAASAFFLAGMPSAAVMTVDGEGEVTTTLFGEADLNRGVQPIHEIPRPDSLGYFYGSMTEYLGFEMHNGEYKVMGMAPYGDPSKADLGDLIRWGGGDFRIDLSSVHVARRDRWNGKPFSQRLVDRLGPPRTGDGLSEPYIHIAAATQKALEDATLHLMEHHLTDALKRHEGRLCFAGGCALNVRLNRKIIAHPLVSELWVQPAAGDAGLSLGAAAVIAHQKGDELAKMTHAYHGPSFSDDEIEAALEGADLPWRRIEDPAEVAASLLAEGHVVAWFQGRMEWGPRALGNRSILGNPTVAGTADRINEQIKFRELWRPFCPSILAEHAKDLLHGDHDSPFMTFTFMVKDAWKERVKEIVHVDGSARPQFVTRDANPLYYELIDRFREKTGAPVVINTSLNRKGEPMVCSPPDAIAMFKGSGLTHMVMGRVLVEKRS